MVFQAGLRRAPHPGQCRGNGRPERELERPARGARRALAALLLGGWSLLSHAEFVSNAQLLDWLQEATKRGGSFKDTTLAIGFLSGVHDQLAEGEACLPDRTSARSLLPAVLGWMRQHPELWAENGARTARRALMDTFPCPRADR